MSDMGLPDAYGSPDGYELLKTIQSADIVLPTTNGREIRLRRVTTPTAEQKNLLDKLGFHLPDRLDFDHECSGDSRIA